MSYQPPPTQKSSAGLWLGGAVIFLVALIMAIVLLLNRQPAPVAPAAAVIVSAATATPELAAAASTDAATPTPVSTETPTSTPLPELGTSNLFIEYILDASGSMRETLDDGSPKIEVAQRVLTEHMRSFRPETNIGLRAYGHRLPYQQTAESCRDIELIAPPQKGQMERIAIWLQDFTVQGMTPLAASLELAREDFVYDAARINSIVMLSDGIETCGGDPCRLVETLKAEGINFTIHVIGLDVDDPTRRQLMCIAEAGGGTYHDARSQQELNAALGTIKSDVTRNEVIEPASVNVPPAPGPAATVNTQLVDVPVGAYPSAYLGSWQGSATQINPGSQWTILMTLVPAQLGEIAGNIAYPSLRCGGHLTLQSVSPSVIELLEDITYGDCVDLGTVRLTLDGSDLSYYWFKPGFSGTANGTVGNVGRPGSSVEDPFTGVWIGRTTQGGIWTILLGLHGGNPNSLVGTIAYPSLRCGGELALTQTTTDYREFDQSITFGNCVDRLIVELTMQPDGTLFYSERYSDGRVSGSGVVQRMSISE